MHNVCLGVVKLLFLLTFDVGVSRIKGIRRQKVTQLSEKLLTVKNPSEFSRRTRIIDFANFKAQEWRNLILFYFPLVISSIQERKNEKQLWLLLAFIVRAYTLPEEHYEDILLKVNLKNLQKIFYQKFESHFGKEHCLYNVHIFYHLDLLRKLGPITRTSAFSFEGYFSLLKNDYQVGTQSIGKQAMNNSYSRILSGHTCEKKLKFCFKATKKCDDTIVYFENGGFFKLISCSKTVGFFVCQKIILENAKDIFEENELPFSCVGVYIFKGEEQQHVELAEAKIAGKGIIVGSFLIAVSKNVLLE